MEGYLRAANRISSLAVGDPKAAASATTYKVPRTGSQMRHVEGAPFGTRGGIAVMHTFPADGEYTFRMQLHSIPTGQLFGSTVKGELLEVSIDGERAAVLEINPRMSEADPNGMNIDDAEDSRQGGHAATWRRRSWQRFDAVPDDLMPPIDHTLGRLANRRGLRHHHAAAPARVRGDRTVQRDRRVGHAEPPRIFTCRPTSAADEATCAAEIIRKLATQAYRGPLSAADFDGLHKFYQQGRKDGDFESGIRMARAGDARQPAVPVPARAAPATVRAGQNYRITRSRPRRTRCRSSSGRAGPDDELLKIAQRGTLRAPGVLAAQVKRMLQDPQAGGVGDALRIAVAAAAGPRQDPSRRAAVPLLRPHAR